MVARGIDGTRRMVLAALMSLAFAACVADDERPTQIQVTPSASTNELAAVEIESYEVNGDDRGDDVCGMAAALPVSDVCSLVCEPDAFAARLREGGMHAGACYQLRCALSPTTTVSVGVCLP